MNVTTLRILKRPIVNFRLAWSRQSGFRLPSFRTFGTTADDDDKPKARAGPSSLLQHPTIATSSTGIGQVIFLNSSKSGAIIAGSLALGDPWLATLAVAGSTISTLTATQSGLDATATHAGLRSYNGCLVGCATAVFIAPLDGFSSMLTGAAVTVAGAGASTYVSAALARSLSMPQWTWAFNIVTLTALLRVKPFQVDTSGVDSVADTTITASENVVSFTNVLTAPLTSLSQIFVVESSVTGLGIVAAVATYSPALAIHALSGAATGCLTGWILGAPVSEIAAGLWGFNAALTSMGVAVFFKPTTQSNLLSVGGAVASTAVFGALQQVFGALYSPCLTLPFCVTMTGCYLLADTLPGLNLASTPHSPEKN